MVVPSFMYFDKYLNKEFPKNHHNHKWFRKRNLKIFGFEI